MTKTALIACAGAATVASAQTATINLTPSSTSVATFGAVVTWTLSVEFDGHPGDPVAAGGNMLIAGNSLAISSDFNYTPTNGGNNGGTASGSGGIGFVNWTNSLFIEAFDPTKPADRSNPFVVGTFTTTSNGFGWFELAVHTGQAASSFLTIGTSPFGGDADFEIGNPGLTMNIGRVFQSPTPASAALFVLGSIVAFRRRR